MDMSWASDGILALKEFGWFLLHESKTNPIWAACIGGFILAVIWLLTRRKR